MTGTAFFALKARALLVPVYSYPIGSMGSEVDIQHPIELSNSSDFDQAVFETTAAIFRNMEAMFNLNPAHWIYWGELHQRFAANTCIGINNDQWGDRALELLSELRLQSPALTSLWAEIERQTRKLSRKSASNVRS